VGGEIMHKGITALETVVLMAVIAIAMAALVSSLKPLKKPLLSRLW